MKRLAVLIALASPAAPASLAQAYSGRHEMRSQLRPYVAGNFFLGQQAQAALTEFRLSGAGASENLRLSGVALKSSLGIEHLRCLQTSAFYVNTSQTSTAHGLRQLAGHEFGAEAKLSLNSPLMNVAVGGGGFFSNSRYRGLGDSTWSLAGSGAFGVVELTYYVSERVSLALSGTQVMSNLQKGNLEENGLRGKANSTRLGAGLAIWL